MSRRLAVLRMTAQSHAHPRVVSGYLCVQKLRSWTNATEQHQCTPTFFFFFIALHYVDRNTEHCLQTRNYLNIHVTQTEIQTKHVTAHAQLLMQLVRRFQKWWTQAYMCTPKHRDQSIVYFRVSNPVFTETEKPGNPEFFQNRKTGFGLFLNPVFRFWHTIRLATLVRPY